MARIRLVPTGNSITSPYLTIYTSKWRVPQAAVCMHRRYAARPSFSLFIRRDTYTILRLTYKGIMIESSPGGLITASGHKLCCLRYGCAVLHSLRDRRGMLWEKWRRSESKRGGPNKQHAGPTKPLHSGW